MPTVFTTFLLRQDTAANWTLYNPVLACGEPGFELPTVAGAHGGLKLGDGVTDWNNLPYAIYPYGSTPPVSANILVNLDIAVTPNYTLPAAGEVILRRKDAAGGNLVIAPSVVGQTVLKQASVFLDMQGTFLHLIFNPQENDWNQIG